MSILVTIDTVEWAALLVVRATVRRACKLSVQSEGMTGSVNRQMTINKPHGTFTCRPTTTHCSHPSNRAPVCLSLCRSASTIPLSELLDAHHLKKRESRARGANLQPINSRPGRCNQVQGLGADFKRRPPLTRPTDRPTSATNFADNAAPLKAVH